MSEDWGYSLSETKLDGTSQAQRTRRIERFDQILFPRNTRPNQPLIRNVRRERKMRWT